MIESKRTSLLLSRLRKRNPDWLVWKISGQMTGGWPDALAVGPRTHVWVEFKNVPTVNRSPQLSLTALQCITLAKLQSLGQRVLVVGLLPDGTQTVSRFNGPLNAVDPSKTALEDYLEATC